MSAAIGRNMRRNLLGTAGAVVMGLASASAAYAQDSGSVSDYRLPDPNRTPAPRAQGPVDPDNPYGLPTTTPQSQRRPSASPTPAPVPAPTATPRVVLPAPQASDPASARPTPRPTPTRPERPAAVSTTTPTPEPSASPTPSPTVSEAPATEPVAAPSPDANAQDAHPVSAPAPQEERSNWLLPAAILAVLAAGGIALLMRRKGRARTGSVSDSAPAAPASPAPLPKPAPPSAPPLPVSPAERAVPATVAPAAPAPSARSEASEPLEIAFAAKAIRLSLVYATLQYELTITNTGTAAVAPLQVRADLSSAHASLSTQEQLAPAPDQLELKHEVPALPAGETAALKGEVRVPLQQIRPLVKSGASFLVPLARFCIVTNDGSLVRRVFTAGARDPGSEALTPVRLDAGPRNLRELDSREIEAARGLARAPAAAHG